MNTNTNTNTNKNKNKNKKAVVLLSGGLDSATVLAIAKNNNFDCYAISFNYSQRHVSELNAAKKIASLIGVIDHQIFDINLAQFGGSALTDKNIEIPINNNGSELGIPITYVPARNTIMLSIALGFAEVIGANDIFYGANSVDYSGYPDCRPEYIASFELMANLATQSAVEGNHKISIHAPIVNLTKAEIIKIGHSFGIDYAQTVSCYKADDLGYACGVCDSCRLRKIGFNQAGIDDPTIYQINII
jgi:7-cyano-7-deazaguanine synthase